MTQPSAEPSAPPSDPLQIAFELASVPEPQPGSSTLRVVSGSDGLVAIGFDGAFGSILWTSVDGRSWTDATPVSLGD